MIEIVEGTIIGDETWRYEFWQDGRLVVREFFASDDEAEEWFGQNYPGEYSIGVEMRCYDN